MEKIALVTGCSSEVGSQIARLLKDQDYQVYEGFSRQLDVTQDSQIKAAVEKISLRHKHLDVLVNAAGLTLTGSLTDFSANDFSHLLNVNVVGPFRLIKAAVPLLKKSPASCIVNISSISSFFASPNYGLYSASKHALHALGWVAALELDSLGIRVINITPGAVRSNKPNRFTGSTPARVAIPVLGLLLPLVTPKQVARKVIRAINTISPSPLILVGRDAYLLYYLQKILPAFIWFKLQRWLWQRQH